MATIKVVPNFGGASLGEITVEEGMITQHGTITRVSGSICFVGSGTSESQNLIYDYYLEMASGQAFQQFSWPTGVNCETYSHSDIWPNGIVANIHSMSGHTVNYHGDLIPETFGR